MFLIDRLNKFLGEKLAWLYLAAVAVTAYEVVMRYLVNAPTTWAFELTIFFCAVCYLLAGGYVTQKEEHIAITRLRDALPMAVQWWLKLFAIVVGLFAMGGLIHAAWKPALQAIRIGERTGSAWNAPTPAIIKPLIFVSAILIFLQLLVIVYRHLRGRTI